MRRIVSVFVLALMLLASAPCLALAQDVSGSGSGESGESASGGKQSRIVVRSQKKKREFKDKIVVIQRKPFMRRHRAEIAPYFFGSINDSMLLEYGVGLNVNFHALEWLYIGLTGNWQDWRFASRDANGLSDFYYDSIDATDAIPSLSIVNGYAGLVVGFVPLNGKFSIFNTSVVHWDLSIGIGGAAVSTRGSGDLPITGGGLITIEHRMFLLKWLSLNVGVRGLIYYDDIGSKSGIFTHWQAGIGVGFWVPPTWTYKSDW